MTSQAKSLLGRGAASADADSGPLWIRDPAKIVRRALAEARNDSRAKRVLLHGIVRLAAADESIRRRLSDDLKRLPPDPGGQLKEPGSDLLLAWVDDHRRLGKMTIDQALSRLVEAFPELFPDNLSALRQRYQRYRRAIKT